MNDVLTGYVPTTNISSHFQDVPRNHSITMTLLPSPLTDIVVTLPPTCHPENKSSSSSTTESPGNTPSTTAALSPILLPTPPTDEVTISSGPEKATPNLSTVSAQLVLDIDDLRFQELCYDLTLLDLSHLIF